MRTFYRPSFAALSLGLLIACGSGVGGNTTRSVISTDPAPIESDNFAAFDPSTGNIPLPNILATATATSAVAVSAGVPLDPSKALTFIAQREMGGPEQGYTGITSTHAVSGLNAPILVSFGKEIVSSTFNATTVKVFQLTPDSTGLENNALGFANISSAFTYVMDSTNKIGSIFPNFPLQPATRYLYVITDGVKDAASNLPVSSSFYFRQLKSTTSLTGTAFASLEAVRADQLAAPGAIALRGYASVMNDLIAASSTTGITSRQQIALMGRFITTGAGYIRTDRTASASVAPVEFLLRAWANGATFTNAATVTAVYTKGGSPSVNAYWTAAGLTGVPNTHIKRIITGTFNSALLHVDVASLDALRASSSSSITATGGVPTALWSPSSGVRQVFRSGANFAGFYHIPKAVPFIYMEPDPSSTLLSAPSEWPLAIFQHGIGGQKEQVATLANALMWAGRAVIAIDQPLHGELAYPGRTASQWSGDFLAVGAPLAARTSVENSALNTYRLIASLSAINSAITSTDKDAPMSTSNVGYIGISLGGITGAYTMAGMPYPGLPLGSMKAALSVPGGRLAYLIRDSGAFGPVVNSQLGAVGITQGSLTWHQFYWGTQTVADTVDPATVTSPLAAGQPSRLSGRILVQEVLNDTVVPNSATRYFVNALGGRSVLGLGQSAAVQGALDAIAPNFKQLSYNVGSRIVSPVIYGRNATNTNVALKTAVATTSAELAAGTNINLEGFFQFDQSGSGHGALLSPTDASNALVQRQAAWFLGYDLDGLTYPRAAIDPVGWSTLLIPAKDGSQHRLSIPDVQELGTYTLPPIQVSPIQMPWITRDSLRWTGNR
jgi:hypothetical protein